MNTCSAPFRSLALAALLACLGGTTLAQDAKSAKAAAPARPSMTVTTTKAVQSSMPLRLAANGNIAAWQEASIGAQSNGLQLAEVRAAIGDVVKRGQVLAVFDAESVQADVAQVRALVAEAQAQAAEATANADRARALQPTGVLSGQQTNQLLTAELTAKARLESAKATLAVQQLRLKHTQVLAPDNGIISARNATVGAVVGAGTELFRLIRQGRLEWRAEVTATELGRVSPGGKVSLNTASGATVQGKVRMVGPTVDPQTRNALVYVDLESSANGAARAGMFARGEFELGSTGALTVPQQAVVVRDGFTYVFKVGADNRVAQQKVDTGRRIGDQVEILQGLTAEATIAVAGAGFLNDGDTVRIGTAPVASVPNPAPAPVKSAQPATK